MFQQIRRALIGTTYLAFACRLLVPAGYMPAAWSEGGPISLCPMGLPAGLVSEHTGHHHQDEDNPGTDLLWEFCPLGALSDTASAVPEIRLQLPVFQHARPVVWMLGEPVSFSSIGFRPRAPPRLVA